MIDPPNLDFEADSPDNAPMRLAVCLFLPFLLLLGCQGQSEPAGDEPFDPVDDDDNDNDNDDDDDDNDDDADVAPRITWVECAEFYPTEWLELISPETRCGTAPAPADWENPDGRIVDIRLALVPAAARSAAPLLAVHLGGPDPNLRNLILLGLRPEGFLAVELHERFDLLFVEGRGSSMSSTPLVCANELLGQPYANADEYRSLVQQCLDDLPTDVSPALLSTADAARDLDRVRQALGAATLRLFGNSYGTRLMLEYLRRHEARVEAYALDSVLIPQGDGKHDLDRILKSLAEDCDAVADCPYATGAEMWNDTDALLNGKSPAGAALTVDLFHLGDQPDWLAQWPAVLAAGWAGNWEPLEQWHADAAALLGPTVELPTDWTNFAFDPYSDNVMCIDYPGWNDFVGREFVLNQLHPPYVPLPQIEWMTHLDCEELAARFTRPPSLNTQPVVSAVPGLLIAPRLDQALPWSDAFRAIDEGLSGATTLPVNADHALLIDLGQPGMGWSEADQQCLRALVADWLDEPFDPFSRPCVDDLVRPLPIGPLY